MGLDGGNGGGRAPNRRAVRKRRKRSALARITGASDEAETIECVVQGCNARFSVDHELESHLRVRHGLAFDKIEDVIAGGGREEVVFARAGLQGEGVFATNEDLEAEAAFDMLGGSGLVREGDIEGAGDEADFWLGGKEVTGDVTAEDEWVREEEEMRRLISDEIYGGEGGEGVGMDIDPTLV